MLSPQHAANPHFTALEPSRKLGRFHRTTCCTVPAAMVRPHSSHGLGIMLTDSGTQNPSQSAEGGHHSGLVPQDRAGP